MMGEKNGKLHDATTAWLQHAPSALAGHVSPRKLLITVTHLRRLSQTASKPQPISLDRGTSLGCERISPSYRTSLRIHGVVKKRKKKKEQRTKFVAYLRDINLEPALMTR